MYQTLELLPGVKLRTVHSQRFKQGALSIQLLRPMDRQEAGANALLPAVLLRGCQGCEDIQKITARLDDLYGAYAGTQVQRIGDYQTTGLCCGFIEDRFAMAGDRVLEPLCQFSLDLLLKPLQEKGAFLPDFVEGEKDNLISAIESRRADKRAYCAQKLISGMCRDDSMGVSRLGEIPRIEALDARTLHAHYETLLKESPIEIFYVGSARPEQLAEVFLPALQALARDPKPLPPTRIFPGSEGYEGEETMEVAQSRLHMGFTTTISSWDPDFAAMQVCNRIFGSGQTSKLFTQIREKESLCYEIDAGYTGSKGILAVSAGMDAHQAPRLRQGVLDALDACCREDFSQGELEGAKASLLSALEAVYDSPGALMSYYATAAMAGIHRPLEEYAQSIRSVTARDVARAAQSIRYDSSFFLKGEAHG